MSVDVQLLNAFLEQNEALSDYYSTGYDATYSGAYTAAYNLACSQSGASALQYQIDQCPCAVNLWCSIPLLTNTAGEVLVCDTSGYFRCGRCCLWTVPAGVTCAQFQIWGAGAGSTAGCCCGGGMPGGSGAYVTAIVPVTAGETYTLCAGCAYCCYPTPAGSYCGRGCTSFVIGPAVCNLCAEGGVNWSVQNVMDQSYNGALGSGSLWCTHEFFPNSGTIAGPCICGSNNYCGQGCATCGEIVVHRNSQTCYFGIAANNNGIVMGIPGMHGGLCMDTNQYGHVTHPPVINTTHTGAFGSAPNCGCRVCFTSEACWGGCLCGAQNGVMQFPGAGGFATHAMGGGIRDCGDAGRMGMVRVIYK